MLQVFYLDVAYVSHIYCNNMFQIFHLCQTYVASKCFMLQVLHEDMVSDGRQGMGRARARDDGRGTVSWGRLPGPSHAEIKREKRGQGKECGE
jgi:hypothetical protein